MLDLYEGDGWRDESYYNNWTYENWKKEKGKDFYLVQENINLVRKFLKPGSRILDVGCGIGLTVRSLQENGYQSEGVEVSSIGSKIAAKKTGIKVHHMKLENYQSNTTCDGVCLLNVLEHLYDPAQILKECARNLNKNGYIFIHVPHHREWGTKYKKFLHKKGLKHEYKHFGFPAHIYAFDKKSLTHMLQRSGFEAIHFESWSNILTRGRVNIFNYLLVQLIRRYSLSDYIVCIARKI